MAISKELSKEIDIITREVSEPAIEAMMSQIRDYLKVVSQKPYAIKENQEEVINESREILAQWVTGEDERHLVEEGFGLVCQETSRSSEGKNLLEEFKQVGMRIQERISKTHLDESEKEVNVFNTIQDSLGISNKSIDTIYKIGNDFMHNKEIHKGYGGKIGLDGSMFIVNGIYKLRTSEISPNSPQKIDCFLQKTCFFLEKMNHFLLF